MVRPTCFCFGLLIPLLANMGGLPSSGATEPSNVKPLVPSDVAKDPNEVAEQKRVAEIVQPEALAEKIARLSTAIEASPREVTLYSQRGDAHFFLGHFESALADYSQMTELDPMLDGSHWRRGIAYFYAGQFADGAAQFERYHSFDNVDRENGIWRFLCQMKASGLKTAREGLLKYEKDDREPFPDLYRLFAGTVTPEMLLENIDAAKLSDVEREKRLFYAHLYLGLYASVTDDQKSAQKWLDLCVKNTWGPQAGYGPSYMWHVGRLHVIELRKEQQSKDQHGVRGT